MLHTAVYNGVTAGVVNTEKVDAEPDAYLNTTDGAFTFPREFCLYTWWMFDGSGSTRRFRLESSHWRKYGFPTFIPALNRTAGSIFPTINPDISRGPRLIIPKLDPVYAFVEHVSPLAVATRIALWVGDCNFNYNGSDVFTLRFNSVVPAIANTWVKGLLTPEFPLPAGKYQVIGGFCGTATTTQLFVRVKFFDQNNMPGMPILSTNFNTLYNFFRYGHYGIWGEFKHTQIPTIEFLGTATGDESLAIELDMVKIG